MSCMCTEVSLEQNFSVLNIESHINAGNKLQTNEKVHEWYFLSLIILVIGTSNEKLGSLAQLF